MSAAPLHRSALHWNCAQASMPSMRPPVLNPLFASLTSLPGVGPKLEKLYVRLLDRETPRAVDLLFHLPSGTIDRRARPKLRDVQAGQVVTVAVTIGKHRPGAASPLACALSRLCKRRHRRHHADLFQPTPRLSGKIARRRVRYISGTAEFYDGMLQMVHPDRVVDEAGLATPAAAGRAVYPLTEGLALGNVRRAMEGALSRLRSSGMARWSLDHANVSSFCGRATPIAQADGTTRYSRRRTPRGRASRMTNCSPANLRSHWSAHMRRQPGRGSASEGRLRAAF